MYTHYTQTTRGRLTIATTEEERRRVVRDLARRAGPRLLFFCLVDDHLHAVLAGARLGYLVRDLRRTVADLRRGLALDPAHQKPITSKDHLSSALGYLLRQPTRHGLVGVHPALYSGSCFQDLIGLRLLAGFDPRRLSQEDQRLRQRDLFTHVGLAPAPIEPASDERLRDVGAARIVELAAATFGVGPALVGIDRETVRARRLASHVAMKLDLPTREVARVLGIDPRSVRRLGDRADAVGERALRRRLTLEDRVAGATDERLGA